MVDSLLDSNLCRRSLLMSSELTNSSTEEGEDEGEDDEVVCGGSRARFLLFTIQLYIKRLDT